ncbi:MULTISPECIES: hypothetical protein [Burkholderia]|uniref:hypothetical protein n=1 Tax=Burkholderia TaxID=32008 RepID=UPI0012E3ADE3|nr:MULTISPECIES: hypothetical protein [Burkholderia]
MTIRLNALPILLSDRQSNSARHALFSGISKAPDIPIAASGEIPTRNGWCSPIKRLSSLHRSM